MPKTAFKRGRKVCIFCGGTPISEEHIWPRWASHILPTSTGHQRFLFTEAPHLEKPEIHKQRDRQGSVKTIRIPRVCRTCNSGWMSTAESEVRPIIEPMMRGERVELNDSKHLILTNYLTCKIMICDWADGYPIFDKSENEAFYIDRAIPERLVIKLFKCEADIWQQAYRSQFLWVGNPVDNPLDHARNTKSFAIGFGNLFVFAFISKEVQLNMEFNRAICTTLRPNGDRLFVWPPRETINRSQAGTVATTLRRLDQYEVRSDGG